MDSSGASSRSGSTDSRRSDGRPREKATSPSFMQERDFNGLKVCFDEYSIKEYEADAEAYDEIFTFTERCHRKALARFGQCPIVVIGHEGPHWEWGARIKEREEGIDLGDPIEDGVQYFGNFYFKLDEKKV